MMDFINNNNNVNSEDFLNAEEDSLSTEDFVMYKDASGNYIGGGYRIKSDLLNSELSPMHTLNFKSSENKTDGDTIGGGNNVSSPFENLVVPAGLFFINQKMPKCNHDEKYSKHTTLSDDMHDKLFALINLKNPIKHKNKKTKKHMIAIKHKKTKKATF
jgi:hypothetical protein